ncbi:MAG TPA: HAD-IC family P-type ATPase, partial [Opitutales bacterium]|nr:HAD-IC family P-type ATPase [Opitutales bacterium]
QLQAVQALGSVPYLFVDKTGTLTENSMELVKLVSPEDEWELEGEEPPDDIAKRILEIGVLCNGASIDDEDEPKKGDPLEIALLEAGRKHGIEKESLEEAGEKLRTVEFDRETMMMAVFYRRDDADEIAVAVKGAPERVLSACSSYRTKNGSDDFDDETREKWIKRAEELAGEGYRILAAASKTVDSEESEPYDALDFHGFFVMEDPLRENVAESIDECEAAGIKIIMVTGDKPETAEAIARDSGIGKEGDDLHLLTGKELDALELENEGDAKKVLGADMAARVEPQQKMDLIEAAQADGEAVGMTGDGVNDAPALKRANIGIAMGERGTEAAKEVADIVLRDDALGTIVEAVRRGRTIMDNIRKAAMFFLCTNLAEIIALVVGAALDYPLPLLALQILYLNVITDVFPALALGLGPADQNVMNERSERNSRAILAPEHWAAVVGLGLLLAACTLGALVLAKELLGLSDLQATTVSFLTLGLSKVWFPFNLRDYESPFFLNEVTRNSWVWGAVLLCLILLGSAVYFRPLGTILETELIPASAWGMILAFSLVPFVISQIVLVGLKLQKRA